LSLWLQPGARPPPPPSVPLRAVRQVARRRSLCSALHTGRQIRQTGATLSSSCISSTNFTPAKLDSLSLRRLNPYSMRLLIKATQRALLLGRECVYVRG